MVLYTSDFNVNMVDFKNEDFWQTAWGKKEYAPLTKARFVYPALEALDEAGKIGQLVVDVGAGPDPLSGHLLSKPRKIIEIDVAGGESKIWNTLKLEFDINHVGDNSVETRRALAQILRFMGLKSRDVKGPALVDTLMFSQVLNYVDFRNVLGGFIKYLKNDGRMLIFNTPLVGLPSQFSPLGLTNNGDLYKFLKESGFVIESLTFPEVAASLPSGEETILLVAQKRS